MEVGEGMSEYEWKNTCDNVTRQRLYAMWHWGLFTKERITFRNQFWNVIRTLSWFESLILPFVNAKLFQIRLLKHAKKRAVWIVICAESPILRTCERKVLSERDSSVRILEMRAEAMHGSICEVGAKYYLAVRRSCSWSGRRLQCMWTHVVQITNPNQEVDRDPKRLSERDSLPLWTDPMWRCSDCIRCDNVTLQWLYVMWQWVISSMVLEAAVGY